MSGFTAETELAKLVVDWLEKNGWTTFKEALHADIVARKGETTWIIECKRSLTFGVLAQAWAWLFPFNSAHRVSIAVPAEMGPGSKGRDFAYKVCKDHGIGVILVAPHGYGWTVVREEVPAATHDPAEREHTLLLSCCTDEAKERTAGSASTPEWTAYKQTALEAFEYALANPGCLINDLVAGINHCYANKHNARQAIIHDVEAGIFPYLRIQRDAATIVRGRPAVRVWPDPDVHGSLNLMDRRPHPPQRSG